MDRLRSLKILDRPDPEPRPAEVRIAVNAGGLELLRAALARVGMYPAAPKPPSVIGLRGRGPRRVARRGGEGVEPGARVLVGTRFGGHAELAVTAAGALSRCPRA